MVVSAFSSTISLGTLLVGIAVVILYGLGTLRDRQASRWRDLYTLADTERKELSEELTEARAVLAEQKEQIARLDALQMPVRVIESLKESTEAAHERQREILDQYRHHEDRAQARHEATLGVLELIARRLGPEPEH